MDIPRPHQTFESCSNIAIIVILDKIKLKFLTCAIFICNKCCAHIAYRPLERFDDGVDVGRIASHGNKQSVIREKPGSGYVNLTYVIWRHILN
jgi:hypothetical protein